MTTQDAKTLYLFHQRCKQGDLEGLKVLHETFGLTASDARSEDNFALRQAADGGHLKVCQWLVETFGLTAADARNRGNAALCHAAIEDAWVCASGWWQPAA